MERVRDMLQLMFPNTVNLAGVLAQRHKGFDTSIAVTLNGVGTIGIDGAPYADESSCVDESKRST